MSPRSKYESPCEATRRRTSHGGNAVLSGGYAAVYAVTRSALARLILFKMELERAGVGAVVTALRPSGGPHSR